jgi:hypothetical protein
VVQISLTEEELRKALEIDPHYEEAHYNLAMLLDDSRKEETRKMVAVRTFADWEESLRPGFMEMDLVTHCGPRAEGSFVHSLVLTDVASGWIRIMTVPS